MEWMFAAMTLCLGVIIGFVFCFMIKKDQEKSFREQEQHWQEQINEQQHILSEATAIKMQMQKQQQDINAFKSQIAELNENNSLLRSQNAAQHVQLQHLQNIQTQHRNLETDYQDLQQECTNLQIQSRHLSTLLEQERSMHAEKIQLLTEAKESLSQQFQVLANQILEEKSQKFSEQNQQGMQLLLNPLQEKIQGFSRLVQDTYEKESKERLTLENELKRLQTLNSQLNTEASALTKALTGTQNKTQGNWGEMVLEKVLESSGLRKDKEYFTQASHQSQDDMGNTRRLQPDVIVNLPENKQIIIDSKVSLTAYVRYTQAQDDKEAQIDLRAHLASIRAHIKSLSEKNYHALEGLQSLDFVLMFIPVEPAYLLALQHDDQLQQDAFDKRIMLVGPSTLLATLRTVAHIWRSENQNQNALQIAKDSGRMYDKFVGFVESLEKLGKNMEQSNQAYQQAMNQLSQGRGNLINRAEKLRGLGIKANKQLNPQYLNDEDDEDTNRLPESLM